MTDQLFLFPQAVTRDPAVDAWLESQTGELRLLARAWFEMIRNSGEEVRELLHDGRPTACVNEAAFAYVDAFKSHVNVGFFRGSELADPRNILEGSGKLMRHVKLRPGQEVEADALSQLIENAYLNMKQRTTKD